MEHPRTATLVALGLALAPIVASQAVAQSAGIETDVATDGSADADAGVDAGVATGSQTSTDAVVEGGTDVGVGDALDVGLDLRLDAPLTEAEATLVGGVRATANSVSGVFIDVDAGDARHRVGTNRGDVSLFTSIDADPALQVRADGASVIVANDRAHVRVWDTPYAVTNVRSDGGSTLYLGLPADAIVRTSNHAGYTTIWIDHGNDVRVFVRGQGLDYDAATHRIAVQGWATARLDAPITAHASTSHGADADATLRIRRAASDGTIAVETFADPASNAVATARYGHVATTSAWVATSGDTWAHLDIEADDAAPGTVVSIVIDADDVPAPPSPDARADAGIDVRFDGQRTSAAASLDDVLDWSDDAGPEHVVVRTSTEVRVLVSVPHFSPHTIDVGPATEPTGGPHAVPDADSSDDAEADGSTSAQAEHTDTVPQATDEPRDTPQPVVVALVASAVAAAFMRPTRHRDR